PASPTRRSTGASTASSASGGSTRRRSSSCGAAPSRPSAGSPASDRGGPAGGRENPAFSGPIAPPELVTIGARPTTGAPSVTVRRAKSQDFQGLRAHRVVTPDGETRKNTGSIHETAGRVEETEHDPVPRRKPVNRRDRVQAVATQTGVERKQVETVLRGFRDVVTAVVAKGEPVSISGFAKFAKVDRPARMGRNPQTQEPVRIRATKRPRITPLKAFKDAVAKTSLAPKLARGVWPPAPAANATAKSTAKSTAKKSTAKKSTKASTKKSASKKATSKGPAAKRPATKKASTARKAAKKATAKR